MKFILLSLLSIFSLCALAQADTQLSVLLPDGSEAKHTEVTLHNSGWAWFPMETLAADGTPLSEQQRAANKEKRSITLKTDENGVITVPEKWHKFGHLRGEKEKRGKLYYFQLVIDVKGYAYQVGLVGNKINLKKIVPLRGRVVDTDGKPIKGAKVGFTSAAINTYTPIAFKFDTATTDSNGVYAIRNIIYHFPDYKAKGAVYISAKVTDPNSNDNGTGKILEGYFTRSLSEKAKEPQAKFTEEKLLETTVYPLKILKVRFKGPATPKSIHISRPYDHYNSGPLSRHKDGSFRIPYLEQEGEVITIQRTLTEENNQQLSISHYLAIDDLSKGEDEVELSTQELTPILVDRLIINPQFITPVEGIQLNQRWKTYTRYPRAYIYIKRKDGTQVASDSTFTIHIPEQAQALYLDREHKVDITPEILKAKHINSKDLQKIKKLEFHTAARQVFKMPK